METAGVREIVAGSAVSSLFGGDEKAHDENPGARGLSSSFQSAASGSDTAFMKVEVGTPSDVEQLVEKDVMDVLPAPPGVLLLYWTLVRDGVVPGGLERQFESLRRP